MGLGSCNAVADRADILSVVWPDELRTCLLCACVGTGPEAEEAWRRLISQTGNPKPFFERDLTGLKGLLPLIHAAARRNGFTLDSKMWTYLRAAAVREELRYGAYREICSRVLGAFVKADLPVIALKACALADTVYDTPAERHCHALELLVPANSLTAIEPIVRPLGFRPAWLAEARPGRRRGFRHESGLPLVVHGTLFDHPIYPADMNSFWAASQPATIANVPVRVLAPAHNLLHVLTAAFHDPGRDNLRWVCDAWRLLQLQSETDWSELVRQAQRGGLQLPVFTMLRFLSGSLGARVPDNVLTTLLVLAQQSSRPSYESAISAAIGGVSSLREVWFRRDASPATRRMVLRFLLLPSMPFIQWRFATKSRVLLLFYYMYRPLAYVAQRVWSRALRLPLLNRFTSYGRVAVELKKLRT